MPIKLKQFTTLTFDCYGTLIDWESGIWDAFQPLLMHNAAEPTRETVLQQVSQVEPGLQQAAPKQLYPQLLTAIHHQVARNLGLTTNAELDRDFGASIPHWPAFPDTADALRRLQKHYRLVILSNVDDAGFAASNRKLGVQFAAVYTAQMIGSYKPDNANFEYMLEHLAAQGIEKQHILHTAQSLHHDHVTATRIGLHNAWIDRQGLANSDNWGATAEVAERPHFDFIFATMADMAQAVENEPG